MMAAMVAGTPMLTDISMAILSLLLNPPPLPVCNGEEDEGDGDTVEGLLTGVEVGFEIPVLVDVEPAAMDDVEDTVFEVSVSVPSVVSFVVSAVGEASP
jgi:hypothetical protein